MRLHLKGHSYKFAAEQIMLTLYPDERPEYADGREEPGDNCASLSISEGKQFITASTVLRRGGRVFRGRAAVRRRAFEDGLERDRVLSYLVKISFYKAAVQETGAKLPWGALTGIRPAKIAANILESGGGTSEADRTLRNKYFVSAPRRRLCIEAAEAGLEVKKSVRRDDISLYVGIPFCPTRCAYCSFVSNSVEKSGKLIEPYLQALYNEIDFSSNLVTELGLNIKTVYIGGGTPTTLSSPQLERLMQKLRERFGLSNLLEYTVEAGRPDTVDAEKLAVLKSGGVTRISINPQSMNDSVLKAIGRGHDTADVRRAYNEARGAGFDVINMDIIAGLPTDSYEGFARSLDEVLSLSPENVTVHTLALKKGSRLRMEREGIPAAEEVGAMLDYASGSLRERGFAPYYLYRQKFMAGSFENVGWSQKGSECLYNIYMMEELHTVLSLGAGGVTKLVDPDITRIERIMNPKYPYEYITLQAPKKEYMLKFYREIKERT